MSNKPKLAVLPSSCVTPLPGDRVLIQERLISWVECFKEYWDGDLVVVAESSRTSQSDGDTDRKLAGQDREMAIADLGFELHIRDYFDPGMRELFIPIDVVLASVCHRQNHLAILANETGTALVYDSDNTLQTRLQVAKAEASSMLTFARRAAWHVQNERELRAALSICQGLQANGVPTYADYKDLTPNSLIYFDVGSTSAMSDADLEKHLRRMQTGGPLRLTWSGCLTTFNGAPDLIEVADELRKLGVDFTLDIFGGGECLDSMQHRVKEIRLQEQVTLRGEMPHGEVSKAGQDHFDVWLSPHCEGDPRRDYLEALGNGLPILGYANEALAGLLGKVYAGRTVPIGCVSGLAALIAQYDKERSQLATWSRSGLAFAAEHTMDTTLKRRAEHLRSVISEQD